MMKKIICNLFIAVMVAMLASPQAGAQIVTVDGQRLNTDSVRHEFDKAPISASTKTIISFSAPQSAKKSPARTQTPSFRCQSPRNSPKAPSPGTHTSTSSTHRKYSGTSSRNHCR